MHIYIYIYIYTSVNPCMSMHREKFEQQKEEQGSLGSRPVNSTRHLDRNFRTPFGEGRASRFGEKRRPLDKDRCFEQDDVDRNGQIDKYRWLRRSNPRPLDKYRCFEQGDVDGNDARPINTDVCEGRTGARSINTDVSSRAVWAETTPAR